MPKKEIVYRPAMVGRQEQLYNQIMKRSQKMWKRHMKMKLNAKASPMKATQQQQPSNGANSSMADEDKENMGSLTDQNGQKDQPSNYRLQTVLNNLLMQLRKVIILFLHFLPYLNWLMNLSLKDGQSSYFVSIIQDERRTRSHRQAIKEKTYARYPFESCPTHSSHSIQIQILCRRVCPIF